MQSISVPQPSVSDRRDTALLTLPATGFVREKLLLRFVPFSRATLWRRVSAGSFPAPIRLSVGVTAWRTEDVLRWISEQK